MEKLTTTEVTETTLINKELIRAGDAVLFDSFFYKGGEKKPQRIPAIVTQVWRDSLSLLVVGTNETKTVPAHQIEALRVQVTVHYDNLYRIILEGRSYE